MYVLQLFIFQQFLISKKMCKFAQNLYILWHDNLYGTMNTG